MTTGVKTMIKTKTVLKGTESQSYGPRFIYQRIIVCIANILASASPKDQGLKGKRGVKEPNGG